MPTGGLKGSFYEPGEVSVQDGVVLVDGPDGVAISLSPSAVRT
jgi:hypothetical protein